MENTNSGAPQGLQVYTPCQVLLACDVSVFLRCISCFASTASRSKTTQLSPPTGTTDRVGITHAHVHA